MPRHRWATPIALATGVRPRPFLEVGGDVTGEVEIAAEHRQAHGKCASGPVADEVAGVGRLAPDRLDEAERSIDIALCDQQLRLHIEQHVGAEARSASE